MPLSKMCALLPPNSMESGNSLVAWEGDIFSQVIGLERHGQVRRLGLGPTPTSLWAPSSSNQISSRDCEKVEQLEKEIKMMEQHHANEMKAKRENQARLDSEITLMRSIINRRFPEEVPSSASTSHETIILFKSMDLFYWNLRSLRMSLDEM